MRRTVPLCPWLLSLLTPVAAAQLDLTPTGSIPIQALGFGGVGGMAFDDASGHLWIADSAGVASGTNLIVELDPANGAVLSSISASVVAGLSLGPDALALAPDTGDLVAFSVFNEDVGGVVTQAGVPVATFVSAWHCAALAFDASARLFGIEDSFTGSGLLHELDRQSGSILSDVPLTGATGRISAMDFDPLTGRLVAYDDATEELLEIDVQTGQVLGATDLSPYVLADGFPAGIAFDALGVRLFVAKGNGAGADAILVFQRGGPANTFCFGDGSGAVCPCGNFSAPGAGEGCANSGGGGARLSLGGSASASADDLTAQASGLVPGQPALLFAAENRIAGGLGVPFGDGLRCAGGGVRRLGVRVPDPAGTANWGPGLAALGGWSAGDTRRFQAWYRDPLAGPCGTGFNLSNGAGRTFLP